MAFETIAIVGGGANGVATFIHLVLKLVVAKQQRGVRLVLIEKKEDIGPGLAYGTKQNGHILNTEAGLMGIFAEEPLHFVAWLEQHKESIHTEFPGIALDANAYLPRCVYGRYLQEMLEKYVQEARQHQLMVELLHDEALDADVSEHGVTLQLKSGGTVAADLLVLATGTPKPDNFPHLKESENYIDFPWPSHRLLEKVPREAAVAILGSSLTAIDTALTFFDNGHTGQLTMYSRHGLLPRVQTPYEVGFEREVLTLEQLRKTIRQQKRGLRAKDLFRLFRSEAERVMGPQSDWRLFDRVGKPHLDLLKKDLELALEGESDFQNIAVSTRYLSYKAWKLLPPDQKVLFMKWFGPHWDINRHCVPPQNGRKLLHLLEKGQLTVKADTAEVTWQQDEQQFHIHLKDQPTEKAPYLINATGTAKKLSQMKIPLLQALLKKKCLVPHPAGGATANPDTLQLHVPQLNNPPLYAVGQLLVGEQLDTNSVWFNVSRIDKMTNHLLARLANGHTH